MLVTRIDDPADPRLSDYRDLTDVALRRKLEPAGGLYMAESAKVLVRALAVGHLPRSVLLQEKWMPEAEQLLVSHPDVPVYVVPAEVAEQVTGYAVHRGLLAAMHRPQLPPVADVVAGARRVAVFEDVVDHTNVGAAFRSAAALGVDAVLVTPRCADPLYRRSVRVSMGTVFQVPWTRIQGWPEGIDELQDAGFVVAGMTLGEGAISLDELVAQRHAKLALVFGTEGHGLTAKADRRVDRRVTIPMTGGVDSLNIAAASAVAFYATR
ncbi:TrmH family RNA methyltransferase [Microbacterium kribbense]|uniref:TrmH family RNA methyltransferase n=1 Tax=Microbacterium kribbense TaxID=433645 RepID=UPI003CD0B172